MAKGLKQLIDDNLQWHDFLNPIGMGSYLTHSAAGLIDNAVGIFTGKNQKRNQELQRKAAQEQMDFQWSAMQEAHRLEQESADIAWDRQMQASNTAMQRSVEDMKAAGLNPVLALGSPASTPSAATASASPGQGSKADVDTINQFLSVLNSAMSVAGSAIRK